MKNCKFGCSRCIAPGLTRNGNPYDTCCRGCAISKGDTPIHDHECNKRNKIDTSESCFSCKRASNSKDHRQNELTHIHLNIQVMKMKIVMFK